MTTSVETFEMLRSDIISGRYRPMHLFHPKQLSEEHVVSVAPIREAMLRLSERGLLRWERNRGFFVEKISSSTALFHLDQLRSHYTYAIGRLKDKGDTIELNVETSDRTVVDSVEKYKRWQDSLASAIFSDSEQEFVRGAWDRIWIYRNHYLENAGIIEYKYNFMNKATKLISEKRYDVCIQVTDALFRYVMSKFPDILCSLNNLQVMSADVQQ
ncbi:MULTISPECIES: GntR family transcriptional regulator [Rhizobium]|uniref:GntR family transcriptional regulator n=1 Tax=Rhizobium TaxID=379 RepID=UPI00159EE638|nr:MULTISPECIES: GntR family transcriptional regulator [Rhizobium]MCA0806228.1 GntR family transcriptional regulator [Rhizobium sp. T1473]MCS0463773.1 GntR family transcriptional regulator [Rhizobium favelukesii]UFS84811.1 GntR family transcriptional regulator [Rhizobium sp. T136]